MSAPAPPPRKNRQTPEGSKESYPQVESGSSGMGVPRKLIERDYSVSDFAETPRTAREKLPVKTESILNAVADAIVGADVEIVGEIEFDKLIRIEGKFEGKLVTNGGHVIIGKNGTVIGDVTGVGIVIVYGLLLGNVSASRCQLRAAGQIHGDVICKSMAMDPDVILIGTVNVNPMAPNYIDHEGKVIGKKKPKKKKGPNDTPSATVPNSPRSDEREEDWKSPVASVPEENENKKSLSNSNSKDGKMSVSNSKKSVGEKPLASSDSKKSVAATPVMSNSGSKKSVAEEKKTVTPPPEKKSASPPPEEKKTPHIEPADEGPAEESADAPAAPKELEQTPFSAALEENQDAIKAAEDADA